MLQLTATCPHFCIMLSFLLIVALFFSTALTSRPPPELFSPLIYQKVLATAEAEPNPAQYPQYTDTTAGSWLFFSPDTWTSGFFPVTLYAMNTRTGLCPSPDGIAQADWLGMGRRWSAGEIPLETNTTVGHDVGFLSMPFVAELVV